MIKLDQSNEKYICELKGVINLIFE